MTRAPTILTSFSPKSSPQSIALRVVLGAVRSDRYPALQRRSKHPTLSAPNPHSTSPSSASKGGSAFSSAFFVAWAAATLFHQVSFIRVASTPLEATLSLAAISVLMWPRAGVFALMLGVQFAEVWARAPVVSNHWWTSMFVASTLLLALMWSAARREFDEARWVQVATPALRGILVVVYIWGVVHKLNSDFLDPQVSCGVDLYAALRRDFLPVLPIGAGVRWATIVGTLVVEAAIPVLLLVPRTRRWGVLLGTSFHFVLGFVPYSVYYNFSSMLFALYLLFTPQPWVARMRDAWHQRFSSRQRRWAKGTIVALVILFCGLVALDGPQNRDAWRLAARVPWLLCGAFAIGAYWRWGEGSTVGADAPAPKRSGARALMLMPALFFLNGASPYLGLKTETSLAMYSNLRTEGDRNNHLFLGTGFDLFGHQARVARIRSTSDAWIRRKTRKGYGLVYFELADRLARHPSARVDFEVDGERVKLDRAGDDPRFSKPTPRWKRKLMYFRPVDLRDKQRCIH